MNPGPKQAGLETRYMLLWESPSPNGLAAPYWPFAALGLPRLVAGASIARNNTQETGNFFYLRHKRELLATGEVNNIAALGI